MPVFHQFKFCIFSDLYSYSCYSIELSEVKINYNIIFMSRDKNPIPV
jgi:hypothetical protein